MRSSHAAGVHCSAHCTEPNLAKAEQALSWRRENILTYILLVGFVCILYSLPLSTTAMWRMRSGRVPSWCALQLYWLVCVIACVTMVDVKMCACCNKARYWALPL
ncbi:hypothetical protein V8C86DRAFT_2631295 [Haematococcus lacustris]